MSEKKFLCLTILVSTLMISMAILGSASAFVTKNGNDVNSCMTFCGGIGLFGLAWMVLPGITVVWNAIVKMWNAIPVQQNKNKTDQKEQR